MKICTRIVDGAVNLGATNREWGLNRWVVVFVVLRAIGSTSMGVIMVVGIGTVTCGRSDPLPSEASPYGFSASQCLRPLHKAEEANGGHLVACETLFAVKKMKRNAFNK